MASKMAAERPPKRQNYDYLINYQLRIIKLVSFNVCLNGKHHKPITKCQKSDNIFKKRKKNFQICALFSYVFNFVEDSFST